MPSLHNCPNELQRGFAYDERVEISWPKDSLQGDLPIPLSSFCSNILFYSRMSNYLSVLNGQKIITSEVP